jgi:hypothetical protein
LLRTADPAINGAGREGLVSITALNRGAFTGKVTVGATVFPIRGTFSEDGVAQFGKNEAPSIEVIGKQGTAVSNLGRLALTLDNTAGSERISGTLTLGETLVARLDHADRAIYTARKHPVAPFLNVPAGLLNPKTDKGQYTAILQAGRSFALETVNIPRGSGWAKMSVAPGGAVRILGKLADGSSISFGNVLTRANELPFLVVLNGKTGQISGSIVFDPGSEGSDAHGSTGKWFNAAKPGDALYPAGWPLGMNVEFWASKFIPPAKGSGANALGIAEVAGAGVNGSVVFTDGGLPERRSNFLSMTAGNRWIAGEGADGYVAAENVQIVMAPKTGEVSGSFTHPVSGRAVSFRGVAYQKTHVASGYFLYFPDPAAAASGTLSGAMWILPTF